MIDGILQKSRKSTATEDLFNTDNSDQLRRFGWISTSLLDEFKKAVRYREAKCWYVYWRVLGDLLGALE